MKTKKFLIFDVDDVVTSNLKEISYKMASVLSNKNFEVGFLSGTDLSELKRIISSRLKRKHHILANTGTHYVIMEEGDEKEILNEKLPKEGKDKIINILKNLKELYNLVPVTSEEDQILHRGSQITFSALGRNAPSQEKAEYDPSKKKRVEFVKYLNKNLGEDKYEITIGGTTSIDITLKGRDKGSAIEMFMKENNLKKEDIIFFGDQLKPGGNDFPAIRTGVRCVEVKNPEETLIKLKKFREK